MRLTGAVYHNRDAYETGAIKKSASIAKNEGHYTAFTITNHKGHYDDNDEVKAIVNVDDFLKNNGKALHAVLYELVPPTIVPSPSSSSELPMVPKLQYLSDQT